MTYKLDRRRPHDYSAYLEMYGDMYGDMSDPVKRAETVKALRRRDALTVASALREGWREVREASTRDLLHALKVKRYQIEECRAVRPWNVRNADIRMYRVIRTELRRRVLFV